MDLCNCSKVSRALATEAFVISWLPSRRLRSFFTQTSSDCCSSTCSWLYAVSIVASVPAFCRCSSSLTLESSSLCRLEPELPLWLALASF